MVLKNTMENIVLEAVKEMLKDTKEDFWKDEIHKIELSAYVLNRVKPLYITGSRGILHKEMEFDKNIQEHVDIFSLVAQGMRLITTRRKESLSNKSVVDKEQNIEADQTDDYYYNFPYIMGRVISMSTWEGIPNATVTLRIKLANDYTIAKMINTQWSNPYNTSDKTNGYYTFLINPIKNEKNQKEAKSFDMQIMIGHPKIEPIEKYISIPVIPERSTISSIKNANVHRIEDIYINLK